MAAYCSTYISPRPPGRFGRVIGQPMAARLTRQAMRKPTLASARFPGTTPGNGSCPMIEDEALQASLNLVGEPLTLSRLEQHLAQAANMLRGPIDQADFKSYIFPLLFFKRISDVYLEEYRLALDESGGDIDFASFAENHRFQIPQGAHWNDVRERTENVGQALQQAMRRIEMANPRTLYGIFGDTQWSNKDRLSDALLRDLIEHFSKVLLTNSLVDPDVLGQAYEYLIKRFADLSNKKAGEFYTPHRSSPHGQHPGSAGRRNCLRPCVRYRGHADRGCSAR